MKKYNKKVISHYQKFLDNENFEVFVLDDKDYFNIHVISEHFKDEEMNTLKLQESKEDIKRNIKNIKSYSDYFTKEKLISYLLEHFIWDRFYNEGIFNGFVEVSFDEKY